MESVQENNSTSNTLDDDIPYALVITVAIIMPSVATIGTLGNALVIAAVAAHKKLRSVHNVFVVNLAIPDMLVTAVAIPFAVVGAVNGGRFLLQHDPLCTFIAVSMFISLFASILSVTSIAVERYLYLCHRSTHAKIYNRVTIPLMVVLIWVITVALDSMTWDIIGLSRPEYSPSQQMCNLAYDDVDIRHPLICDAVIGLSFFTIFFCYVRIYLLVRRSTRFRKTLPGYASIKTADKRLLKVFGTIVVILTAMWTPMSVLYALNSFGIFVPNWAHFISGYMVLANSSVNFVIYAFSKDFRDGYKIVCKAIINHKCFVCKSKEDYNFF